MWAIQRIFNLAKRCVYYCDYWKRLYWWEKLVYSRCYINVYWVWMESKHSWPNPLESVSWKAAETDLPTFPDFPRWHFLLWLIVTVVPRALGPWPHRWVCVHACLCGVNTQTLGCKVSPKNVTHQPVFGSHGPSGPANPLRFLDT